MKFWIALLSRIWRNHYIEFCPFLIGFPTKTINQINRITGTFWAIYFYGSFCLFFFSATFLNISMNDEIVKSHWNHKVIPTWFYFEERKTKHRENRALKHVRVSFKIEVITTSWKEKKIYGWFQLAGCLIKWENRRSSNPNVVYS